MQGYETQSRGDKMSYKHLSLEERHYIAISMKNEKTLTPKPPHRNLNYAIKQLIIIGK